MTVIDIVFLALLAISMLWGFWRGLTRELVSTIAWVAIVVLVVRYAAALGELLPLPVPPLARAVTGGAVIVVACVLLSIVVGRLLRAAVAATPLAGADRVLGAIFGALRGSLVALLLGAVVIEFGLSDRGFWRGSVSGPYLERMWHAMAGTPPAHRLPLVMRDGG